MEEKNRLSAMVPALLGVTVAVIVIATMVIFPFEKPSSTAANHFGNAMNGGYVAVDGSLNYYIDSAGALRCYSDYSNYKLSDGGSDSINPSGSYVYFRHNGQAVRDLFTGGDRKVLADECEHMMVSGNWLYYTDGNHKLHKQRLSGGNDCELGIVTQRQFAVVGTYVYYIGGDGYLYYASTDGSGETRFLAEQVDCFQIYGSFVYFICDGRVGSVASANLASRKDYGRGEQFIVADDKLVTVTDGRLHVLDLSDNSAQSHAIEQHGSAPHSLNFADGRIYYYNAEGQLISCVFDGSEWREMGK